MRINLSQDVIYEVVLSLYIIYRINAYINTVLVIPFGFMKIRVYVEITDIYFWSDEAESVMLRRGSEAGA